MTGVTHQMVGLLAALWFITVSPQALGPFLGLLAIIAVSVGALTPDIDQPTANLWRRFLIGRPLGNIFQWFSGGHRHMTHSLLGIAVIGYGTYWIATNLIAQGYYEAARIIWYAYLIGYISHPIADSLTDRGVPWLWPLKFNFRFPPGPEELRVTTGSFVENFIVRGGIIVAALLLIANHWAAIAHFFKP